jgi:hypothetical protein
MNSLFDHEKLGMQVEAQRLGEIHQQVEAQRLDDELTSIRAQQLIKRWLTQGRALLKSPNGHRPFYRLVRLHR